MTESGAELFTSASDREADEAARQAAASPKVAVEAVQAPDGNSRAALYGLLSSVADTKYMLGRRYAEWSTGAPQLESAVAAAAMTQDELGHARSFYPLLRGLPDASNWASMDEQGWQNRPTNAPACLDFAFSSWPDFIAANLLLDSALTVLFEAAFDSSYEPLRQRARKIVQEEESHWLHAEGWTRALGRDTRQRQAFVESLRRFWPHALAWFGPNDDRVVGDLHRAGILSTDSQALRDTLNLRIGALLEEVGLRRDVEEPSVDWSRWDDGRRRLTAT